MKTVAFVFGRMAPVTVGHVKLIKVLAAQQADDHFIYLSHSLDPKKNPLSYEQKLEYVRAAVAEHEPKVTVVDSDSRTAIDVLKELSGRYDQVIFVAGDDRVADFTRMFNAYNGRPDKKGVIPYSFDGIDVVSAGERDEANDDVTGASASKMRAAAEAGDYGSFAKMAPFSNEATIKKMYDDVRKGMGVI